MVFIRFKAGCWAVKLGSFFVSEIIANFAAWRELARRVKFAAPPIAGRFLYIY